MSRVVVVPKSIALDSVDYIKKARLKYGVLDVIIVEDEDYEEAIKIASQGRNSLEVQIEEPVHLGRLLDALGEKDGTNG